MTPHQLNLYIKVYNEQKNQEQEEKLTLTYLGAYWQRVKKMPNLQKILGQDKPSKKMSDQEMFNQVKKLNAMLGGHVKSKEQ